VARLIKILIGFIAGVLYGIIYTAEDPHGLFSKAGVIFKMFLFEQGAFNLIFEIFCGAAMSSLLGYTYMDKQSTIHTVRPERRFSVQSVL
jgi:uncharacterized membrane protein YeaQ/YmgE (transglycosylase-associated protein family)